MAQGPLSKIVIVGGGTAGWMAAAVLARFLPPPTEIVLIESDEIGIVGVGEATVPLMAHFNGLLGIDEAAFVAATQGTFKLGIEFRDWGEIGNVHFNGFGDFGDAIEGIAPHHHWLRLHRAGDASPIEAWSTPHALASRGRFAPADPNPGSEAAFYKHAYHFDAGLYARFLRIHAEGRGVRRREGRIVGVALDPESGFVRSVTLAGGEAVAGDLFVDCSGFAGLLIAKALGVTYRDWSSLLPCDRAVTVGSAAGGQLAPYTRSTAGEAGWRWRIPLQHRTGNGHVYCSAFLSDEAAERQLLEGLDGQALGEPRHLCFVTGHRERFWDKNVVAVGLAAGFMEPLESTSIQLIQTALARLVELLPDRGFDPVLAEEYNRVTRGEWERIRDFLILHYCRSRRSEPFWQACSATPVPDTLAYKIAVWEAAGRVALFAEESYQEPSWVSIFVGNNILPRRYDPLVDRMPVAKLRAGMAQRREAIARFADAMPDHRAFIEHSCPARAA